MITCTLGGKAYTVDFVSGRALREVEPAAKMYARVVQLSIDSVNGVENEDIAKLTVKEALDVMVKWFCLVFGNQFSPDDVYDHCPADRLVADIALALVAVQTQTTEVLQSFPTIPTAAEKTPA